MSDDPIDRFDALWQSQGSAQDANRAEGDLAAALDAAADVSRLADATPSRAFAEELRQRLQSRAAELRRAPIALPTRRPAVRVTWSGVLIAAAVLAAIFVTISTMVVYSSTMSGLLPDAATATPTPQATHHPSMTHSKTTPTTPAPHMPQPTPAPTPSATSIGMKPIASPTPEPCDEQEEARKLALRYSKLYDSADQALAAVCGLLGLGMTPDDINRTYDVVECHTLVPAGVSDTRDAIVAAIDVLFGVTHNGVGPPPLPGVSLLSSSTYALAYPDCCTQSS